VKTKLEANKHQMQMDEVVSKLSQSDDLINYGLSSKSKNLNQSHVEIKDRIMQNPQLRSKFWARPNGDL
jgi:hypothetical protein